MKLFAGGYAAALLIGLWVGMLCDYKDKDADNAIIFSFFLALLGGIAAWGLLS